MRISYRYWNIGTWNPEEKVDTGDACPHQDMN